MKSFKEFTNSALIESVPVYKKASSADFKKGEVYGVYDKNTKSIVQLEDENVRLDSMNRKNAKAFAAMNSDWEVASSSWLADQGIK